MKEQMKSTCKKEIQYTAPF